MPLHIFTSAARNYWPKVAVLLESVRRFHPDAHLHLALADEWPEHHPHPPQLATLLPVSQLPLPNPRAWAFGHTLVELATAIKPFLLEQLLNRADGPVIYLDPDIQLHAPLDPLIDQLGGNTSIILTPHLTHPESDPPAILDNEGAALKHGTYNLGFIAVAPDDTGRAFARWWRQRCTHWCLDDIPQGLFTDQRWCDLVPALFPRVHIERAPGYNVAPWNLNQRRITRTPSGGYTVTAADGTSSPLYFYHYTGWDSGAHHTMAARYGRESPALPELLDHYQAACRRHANPDLSAQPWYYGNYSDGETIPLAARRIYRTRPDLQARYPDPYDVASPDNYRRWYQHHGEHQPLPAAIARPPLWQQLPTLSRLLPHARLLLSGLRRRLRQRL